MSNSLRNEGTTKAARLLRAHILSVVTAVFFLVGTLAAIQNFHARHVQQDEMLASAVDFQATGLKLIKDSYSLDKLSNRDALTRLRLLGSTLSGWDHLRQRLLSNPEAEKIAGPGLSDPSYSRLQEAAYGLLAGGVPGLRTAPGQKMMERITSQDKPAEMAMESVVQNTKNHSSDSGDLVLFVSIAAVLASAGALIVEFILVYLPAQRDVASFVRAAAKGEGAPQILDQHESLLEIKANLESANERIEGAARRFEELFQGLPIACFGYDSEGAIREWNRACEELFEIAPADMFARPVADLIKPYGEIDNLDTMFRRVFEGESFRSIYFERANSGDLCFLLCSTFPVHGPTGKVCAAIFSCVDLTAQRQYELQIEEQLLKINDYSTEIEQRKWELEEANARLESLASTDGLTGVANHRAFQEALARDVKRAKRDGTALSLVLLDVDNFKKYNDSFGHPAGDSVLKQVARLLMDCARESDLIARYGGEEFAIILPSTGMEGALHVAERMRASLAEAEWENGQVTASFGVATLNESLDQPNLLIRAADRALYASKGAGRDCVTHSSDIREAA